MSTQLAFTFSDSGPLQGQRRSDFPAPSTPVYKPQTIPQLSVSPSRDPYSYKELERRVLSLMFDFRQPGRRRRGRSGFVHVSEIG